MLAVSTVKLREKIFSNDVKLNTKIIANWIRNYILFLDYLFSTKRIKTCQIYLF